MEVVLYHHIYTTIGGYKTVYATKGLQHNIISMLERYSALAYPRIGGLPVFAIFPLTENKICCSKALRGGVDHAGRPKACVHNIVIDAILNPLSSSEDDTLYLPPLPDDKLFLTQPPEVMDVPYLPSRLKERTTAEPFSSRAIEVLANDDFRKPFYLSLLLATTALQNIFVKGDFSTLRQHISSLLPLIPRPSRILLSFYSKELPIETVSKYGGSSLCCVNTTQEIPPNAPHIILDTNTTSNMPAMNQYCLYLKENENKEEILKLVLLLERYAPSHPLTFDLYPILIKSFESVKKAITSEGRPFTTLETIRPLMDSLSGFLFCGFDKFVLEILRQVGIFLSQNYDDDSVVASLVQINRYFNDPEISSEIKMRQIEILRNWVLNSLKT